MHNSDRKGSYKNAAEYRATLTHCADIFLVVCPLRFAGQEGDDARSVLCDRPAEQNSPEHSGASDLPPGQVW